MHGFKQLATRMVEQQIQTRGVKDQRVLEAMKTVPRHEFVTGVELADAYSDQALPTCNGQTISQPFMVAYMTELLDPPEGGRVLEVGTGSGYQAAVLAEMGVSVFSIESRKDLAVRAGEILERLGYASRVQIHVGDGTLGWEAHAPYDGIVVTAGAPDIPDALPAQLNDPGRLIIPVGSLHEQVIIRCEKRDGEVQQTRHTPCRFVPLQGEAGWAPEGQ